MASPMMQITFDAADPPALAAFWALALDYVEQPPPPGFDDWEAFADANDIPEERRGDFGAIVDPDGVRPRVLFLRVPEAKTAKNRMHLDVPVVEREAHVAKLVEAGATKVDDHTEFGTTWTVMLDPEGNEFCVVSLPPGDA